VKPGDPEDGAIREGDPPYVPKSNRPAGIAAGRRWVGVGIGLALGCLFSGCTATTQIPDSTGVGDRLLVFAGMLTGPFCAYVLLGATDLSYSPIRIWQTLGLFSIPLIAAYPVRPSVVTACVSAIGLAFWFWAGFISVIYCFYAG
jgi:hypothetical protein